MQCVHSSSVSFVFAGVGRVVGVGVGLVVGVGGGVRFWGVIWCFGRVLGGGRGGGRGWGRQSWVCGWVWERSLVLELGVILCGVKILSEGWLSLLYRVSCTLIGEEDLCKVFDLMNCT